MGATRACGLGQRLADNFGIVRHRARDAAQGADHLRPRRLDDEAIPDRCHRCARGGGNASDGDRHVIVWTGAAACSTSSPRVLAGRRHGLARRFVGGIWFRLAASLGLDVGHAAGLAIFPASRVGTRSRPADRACDPLTATPIWAAGVRERVPWPRAIGRATAGKSPADGRTLPPGPASTSRDSIRARRSCCARRYGCARRRGSNWFFRGVSDALARQVLDS